LRLLMTNVAVSLLEQLFHLAISNNYHTIEDYKENLAYIKKSITNQITHNYGYQFTERST
jgi:hypothetical protein